MYSIFFNEVPMDYQNIFNVFNFNTINLFGVLIFSLLIYCIKYTQETSKREKFISLCDGPRTVPFFGNSLNFILHPEEIATALINYSKKFGSRYRLWIGEKLVIVIANPKDAENALMGSKFLNKGNDFHNLFGRAFGNGTFSGDGTNWKKSRKILQHPLRTNVLDDYTQIMNEEAVKVVQNLQSRANTAETFDILDYLAIATFNIICRTLFRFEELESKEDHVIFREAGAAFLEDSFHSMFQPKLVRKVLKIFAGKRCENLITKIELSYRRAIVEGNLKGKKKDVKTDRSNKNFIECLLDDVFSDEDKKTEIMTYSVGGSETLSVTMSLLFLMLGMHQAIQDKVFDELKGIFGNDTDRDVTLDDIKQMVYLEQVLKEVMRLFPSVPFIFRTAMEDTKLGDLNITAGTELIFDLISIHNDPQYFPNPETFDPERFSEERSKHLAKGCFLPFIIGPRNCIGKAYAWHEMKIICSTILRKYRIHTAMKKEDIKLKFFFVIGNASGNIISISERN